jgi:hypothetical protein
LYLICGDGMTLLDHEDEPIHAAVPDAALVKQPAMSRRATITASEFRVSVADGELFRELSVPDQLFPVRRIADIDRERGIASPFAGPVPSMAINAAETNRTVHADTYSHHNHESKPWWQRPH